jgi:iron-chelate-transporting ATPase
MLLRREQGGEPDDELQVVNAGSAAPAYRHVHVAAAHLRAREARAAETEAPPDEGFALAGIALSIDGKRIVEGVSASIRSNRIYGLIGPNGSGKTSLLRIMARHLAPTSGGIRYRDRRLDAWPARSFAREVAYLPQQLPMGQQLTVKELVGLGRYPWHGPFRRQTKEDRSAVDAAMHITAVDGFAGQLVDTLSGGERQRAWVAMMVAQAGRFLLLDEPTSALDIAHQAHLLELLQEVARLRELGIVMAFHDINIAARFCDEVLAMKEGRVVARGTPAEIIRGDLLSRLYDIEMATLPHPETQRPIGFIR